MTRAGAAGGRAPRLGAIDVLFLCTGNICRSPMAEAFLRRRLDDLGAQARVHSAGLLFDGSPATREGIDVLTGLGYDTSGHRSRRMTAEMLGSADLVLGMAREHVREAVVLDGAVWPRAFTLKELVRRGEGTAPRSTGQPFDEWLAKVHAGRARADLLGSSPDDDVADPIGGGLTAHQRAAAEIAGLVDRLVALAWPGGGAAPPASDHDREE